MNNNDSLVSIIIPVYNTEKYLKNCLESVINQTYKNLEIICIDDGSTDKSLEVLKQFEAKDNRIKVISQNNQGVSAARNQGLDNANGKYLMFVDSDDWIESSMIEELYTLAEKENADAIITGILYENIAEKQLSYRIPTSKRWLSRNNLLNPVANKFHRTEIIKKFNIHFENNIRLGEDFLFNMDVFSRGNKILIFPKIFYHYVFHGKNTVYNIEKRKDIFLVLDEISNLFLERNIIRDSYARLEFDRIYINNIKYAFGALLNVKNKDDFLYYFHEFYQKIKEISYLSEMKKMKIYIRVFLIFFIYIFHLKKIVLLRQKIKLKFQKIKNYLNKIITKEIRG